MSNTFDNLITNRTHGSYYNASDLNRVEGAVAELAAILTACGYPVTVQSKTDWTRTDLPTASEMQRYIGNVRLCVTQFAAVPGVQLPQSMANLTFAGANNIEKVLKGIADMVAQMESSYRICGAYICGGG